jgi:hypothetical protein
VYALNASTLARLALGNNGQVLKVVNDGLAWVEDTDAHLGNADLTLEGDRTIDLNGSTLTIHSASDTSFSPNGNVTVGGDLTVEGDDLMLSTNTLGSLLVADGTAFHPVVLSGDATVSSAGALTINYSAAQSASATTKGFLTAEDWLTFNAKQAALGYTPLNAASNLSDINSAATARINLGLGTLATQSGTFSGVSSGTNTGDQTTITGNAGTATALQTARTINGVSFDGTGNITVTAAANTLTGSALASGITASSLTSVGTLSGLALTGAITGATSYNGLIVTPNTGVISSGTWQGSTVAVAYGGTGSANGSIAGTGALSFTSSGSSAITIDSGTTGAVNVGTGSTAKNITIGNTTSTTALRLQSGTGGVSLQVAGTGTSGNIQVGNGGGTTTPDLLVLDAKSSAGDPTGTNGAMYYNAASNTFRCYQNSAWVDCISSLNASDSQQVSSYASGETVINVASTQSTLAAVSVTPSRSTGDVYVRGQATILSSNSTDQNLVLSLEDDATCSGTTLATRTINITSGSNTLIGTFTIDYIDVDAGAAVQKYSMCASTATGDTDVCAYDLSALVIDTGADIAEVYTTNDPALEAGDVVALDSDLQTGVRKSVADGNGMAIGIVSTRPGTVIGGVEKEGVRAVPVALAGRVPVKVNTHNGPIVPGDYLVVSPSQDGVAMKAGAGGLVIAQAMSGYDGDGVGVVLAFVKNMYLGSSPLPVESITTADGLSVMTDQAMLVLPEPVRGTLAQRVASGLSVMTELFSVRLTAFLASIDTLFTRELHVQRLCVARTDGTELCMTGDDFDPSESASVPSMAQQEVPVPSTPEASESNENSGAVEPSIVSPSEDGDDGDKEEPAPMLDSAPSDHLSETVSELLVE